jgi:hypothetical protein
MYGEKICFPNEATQIDRTKMDFTEHETSGFRSTETSYDLALPKFW